MRELLSTLLSLSLNSCPPERRKGNINIRLLAKRVTDAGKLVNTK